MQTPHLPRAIFGADFETVYEPAEDTFLLLDALETDLEPLRRNTTVCLECGSGSGTVITALSRALNADDGATTVRAAGDAGKQSNAARARKPRLMIATDVSFAACRTTTKCATFHRQNNVLVVNTDLAEALVDRLANSVDLLVFNPPYVPTDSREAVDSKQLQLAWAGGPQGRNLIDRFLNLYVPKLLSKPHGVAYMVALDKNNVDELLNCLVDKYNIRGRVTMKRQAGFESLFVVKYEWIS